MNNPHYLIALSLLALVACGKKETETHPQYKQLVETVYASGNLFPEHEYKVFALGEGYLTAKLVEAGDTVHAGQTLFKIESTVQNIRSKNANEVYQLAKRNMQEGSPLLQELKESIGSAKVKMENDSVNFIRYKNLRSKGVGSQIDYDRSALAYKLSSNEYGSVKRKYQQTKDQLHIELQNAESQFGISSEDASNYNIKSTINGLVYETYKELNELVRRSEPVALIGDANKTYLRLSVDELDIKKIKTGQEIVVEIDVYKGQVFKAVVSRIYPNLNHEEQSFRVDANFTGKSPVAFSGLTVEANIIISKNEKALTLPKTYLFGEDSVLIKKDGQTQKIKIRKGAENFDLVEIVSGLDTNATVVAVNKSVK